MKITSPKALLLIAVVVVGAIFLYKNVIVQSQNSADDIALGGKSTGNPKAKLKITEFVDYQCPSCAHGNDMLHEYMDKYPDQIFLQVKYFPLKGHAHSMPAARFAECANRQGKFWEYHNAVFKDQENWRELQDATLSFVNIADGVGLDLDELQSCVNLQDVYDRIMEDKSDGVEKRLRSTPSYFVNGELFVGPRSLKKELKKFFNEPPDEETEEAHNH